MKKQAQTKPSPRRAAPRTRTPAPEPQSEAPDIVWQSEDLAGSTHSYAEVAEQIRLRILSGELKPGDRLPRENDFAAHFGVSRTTMREALRLLAAEHLIETRVGITGGAFVRHPRYEDIDQSIITAFDLMAMTGDITDEEIHEATLMIGPAIARLAAERRTDAEADELLSLAEPLADDATDEEWLEAAFKFNRLLKHMSRNRVLPLLMRPLGWLIPKRFREQRMKPGWWKRNMMEVRLVAEAIKARDPQWAEEAMAFNIQKYRHERQKPAE